MTKKYVILMIVVFSFSVLQMNCKKEPPIVPQIDPPIYKQSIFLSVTDSGLTEVYLKLSMADTLPPRGYEIFRNNSKVLSGSLFGKETTLVDMTAQMNTSYTYQAFRVDGVLRNDSSVVIATKTLDTTSHEFVFEIDTLGDGASQLYDVAIVNDTVIYAVGEIYLKDSAGNWINSAYNLAKWDGKKWELLRILYDFQGQQFFGPIYSLHVFDVNNIWYGLGNLIHWDGIDYNEVQIPLNAQLNKIFGIDGKNIYVVGYNGSIVHYNGTAWQKIESGTTLPINDIWGARNKQTGEMEILAVAAKYMDDVGRKIFKITEQGVTELDVAGTGSRLHGVGFIPGRIYYVVGAGVHYKKSLLGTESWKQYPPGVVTKFYSHSICVNGMNDIFIAGSFGEIVHYNGSTWRNYHPEISMASGIWNRIKVVKKTIVAVGGDGNRAVVLRGKRQ